MTFRALVNELIHLGIDRVQTVFPALAFVASVHPVHLLYIYLGSHLQLPASFHSFDLAMLKPSCEAGAAES